MKLLWSYMVIAICYQLSYSWPSRTKNVPSAERFYFFDSELLKAIGNEKSGNLVISPVGIKVILGILLEGAVGETADQLRNILRLPDDVAQIRKEFDDWLSLIESVKMRSFLKISNMMFIAKKYPVRRGYQKILKKHYEAGVTPVKFYNRKETSRIINNWVANKTDHIITKFIDEDQINSDAQMIILNTLYFKGMWIHPFRRDRGATRCFHTLDVGCVKTCMLSATGYYKHGYIDRLDSYAVQIPYSGGKFFMLILLPNSKENIFEMTRDLVHVSLTSILAELRSERIFVRIPRFEISYTEDVSDYLVQLQVTEAFRANANFSRIFQLESDRPSLSHIFHSAKITVDEGGTAAAAATGASFMPYMGGPRVSFIAQHPFLFFIMDAAVHSVIFSGRFMKPEVPEDILCPTKSQQPKPKMGEKVTASVGSTLKKNNKGDKLNKSTTPPTVTTLSRNRQKPTTNSQRLFSLASKVKSKKHISTASPTISSTASSTASTIGVTTDSQKSSLASEKDNSSPFATSSLKTNPTTNVFPSSKFPRTTINSPLIKIPTGKPPVFQEQLSQESDDPDEPVRPILIEGGSPFMFYPFNEKLKMVYGGLEASSSASKSTVDPNKVSITYFSRNERSDPKNFKDYYSSPESSRHRILLFN